MPPPISRKLLALARKFRNNPTRQEENLWNNCLDAHPLYVERHKPIGRYLVDFYCQKAKLVVEVEGVRRSEGTEKRHDKERAEFLKSQGLRVLRFSDREVDNNFAEVCERIYKVMNQATASPQPVEAKAGEEAGNGQERV